MVKTYAKEHKCLQSRTVRACTSEFLSKQIVDQIEGNPQIPIRALQDQMQKKFELGISKMKAFRVKNDSKRAVNGGLHLALSSFERLHE